MERRSFFLQPAFYAVLILYFVAGFLTLTLGSRVGSLMYSEDHYFENVGAVSLFVGSVLCFIAFFRAWRSRAATGISWIKLLSYLGLALLFFFGAGEEISWGQRIFNIQTPEAIEQQNGQEELNVHNLLIFEKSELFNADRIFDVFWSVFAVAIPVFSLLITRFRNFVTRFLPLVHWALGGLFVVNYIFAKAAKFLFESAYTHPLIPFAQAVQEVKESNYELLFAFLALYLLTDLGKFERAMAKSPGLAENAAA